jgi:hypothetical protein
MLSLAQSKLPPPAAGQRSSYNVSCGLEQDELVASSRSIEHYHPDSPVRSKPDGLGGASGEIERSAANKRAAIIDAYHDGAAGLHVGHLDTRAEWQASMSSGQTTAIEMLAAGRAGT